MTLSELCIRRPVMTVLLSLSLIIAGSMAYQHLPVAALPSYDSPIISVSAAMAGASPETMASSVATPLEKQFSTIPGIVTINSSSIQGSTDFTLEFDPSHSIDSAAVDVQAAILRAQRGLPAAMTQLPSYRKTNPADAPILLLAISSPSMSMSDLDDFAENLISPSLSTLNGVGQVAIYGPRKFALRIEADPRKLAARNLTLDDLAKAISVANSNSPLGVIQGPHQTLTVDSNKQLLHAADFNPIIIASYNGEPVRLSDVAEVRDSVESSTTGSWIDNHKAIVLAVLKQPNANTVATVDSIRRTLPHVLAQLPSSIKVQLINDRSMSIRDSLHDVQFTLVLTAALVVMVILMFLRHVTATLIPSVTLPISLIGTLALLYVLGYSLDNISLLGLTLSIGLVVDDAIVVLENIMRHIENGMGVVEAAITGAREVSFTIISISLSLVAVFIPIFFMPGVIGLLFHEFAVVVMLAVLVSALVSLTLIPLLSSRLIKPHTEQHENWLSRKFEAGISRLLHVYELSLEVALKHRVIVLLVAISTLFGSVLLFQISPKGFFPQEDIGMIQGSVQPASDASYSNVAGHLENVVAELLKHPAVAAVVSSVTDGAGRLQIGLKPRSDRAAMPAVLAQLRKIVGTEPGVDIALQAVQNLRIGGRQSKSQYQYVMQSVNGGELNLWTDRLQQALANNPQFRDVLTDSKLNGLSVQVEIDRDRANLYGVSLDDVRTALFSAYGERQVASIYTASGTYKILLEVADGFRKDETAVDLIQVRTKQGQLIPLSNVTTITRIAGPTSVNHAGQLQAITISFNLNPGATLESATKYIEAAKKKIGMPTSILTSFAGDAAAFQQSQGSQLMLIFGAIIVIYVLLGILYESYVHPLTILSGLPSAAIGALGALQLFGLELTLVASIGVLLLIGIVKKNAIMMIDFALEAQNQGLPTEQAIRQACLLRFRPITMTTLCALMGALPLAFGLGNGGELRQPLGIAVSGGLIFSQLITLYITPVLFIYMERLRALAARKRKPATSASLPTS